MNILQAIDDEKLFRPWFRNLSTWAAWRAFMAAVFALEMSAEQLEVYRLCTGRSKAPSVPASETWLACGRRAGKSFVLALIAVYLACFRDYRPFLAPGERATILVLACDRRQARVIMRYIRALLTGIPMLAALVHAQRSDSFDLSNGVSIEVATASFRTVRGYALVAALCDEVAFWPTDDCAEPDYEVIDALRPGLATIPGAMLLCASSPHARKGALYDAHRRYYGQEAAQVLAWRAPTRTMNPTVSQSIIDAATERDPSRAASEWLAEFRSDLESFVSIEMVRACVELGVQERAPLRKHHYHGFVDPSGGASDAMTLAVAHKDGERVVIDAIREVRPPFSPTSVVHEFGSLLGRYGIKRAFGDRYAGEWVRSPFRSRGVEYEPCSMTKSELYVELAPLINSGQIILPDHQRLTNQLAALERRVSRAGKDSIDHAPGGHDDIANAVAGAAWLAENRNFKGETAVIAVKGMW